jgi:hypothetical protein
MLVPTVLVPLFASLAAVFLWNQLQARPRQQSVSPAQARRRRF